MKTEKIIINEERNVTLTAYLQETGGEFTFEKRPAMLVLPGGGYFFCSDREADPVAMAYLNAGFQVFILRYSVNEHKTWPNPLEDVERAMELIRSREKEWRLYPDKVAVAGFSAGGHLAACAATMAVHRPNAAIIGYGVTIGSDIQKCNETAPDVLSAVDRNTCPCFVFSSRRDTIVPIVNSTYFISKLAEADVSVEAHIYAYGPHGFSTADPSVDVQEKCDRVEHWVSDSIHWLRDVFGDFGKDAMTGPKFRLHMNDDVEAYFSIHCTVTYLMQHPKTKEMILPMLAQMQPQGAVGEEGHSQEVTPELLIGLFGDMTLYDMLAAGGVSGEVAEQLDQMLRGIEK